MAIPEKTLSEIEGASSAIASVLSDLRREGAGGGRLSIRAERDAEISLLMITRLMISVTEAIEESRSS